MGFVNGTTYRFTNKYYSGHALNVYGTNAASTGRNVCLYTDTPSDIMQKWVVRTSGSGYRMHSLVNNSFVLDCSDGSLSNSYKNNAHLCATSQTSLTDSQVEFEKVSDNLYRIYLPGKNLYLTATNTNLVNNLPASSISTATALTGGTGGQSNVYWAAYSSSTKQQWTVTPSVDGGTPITRNYATYPVKNMKITQGYNDGNHADYADYPFDEACEDTGRSWMYCPCDKMKVRRNYTSGVNTVWMESTEPAVMPCGTDYLTFLVMHVGDDDMANLPVGKTFNRGEPMFREGADGADANHFHISCGRGTITGNGWAEGTNNSWHITTSGDPIKAEQAFYRDPNFTTVIQNKGINLPLLP